jgi:hypothetical protein
LIRRQLNDVWFAEIAQRADILTVEGADKLVSPLRHGTLRIH